MLKKLLLSAATVVTATVALVKGAFHLIGDIEEIEHRNRSQGY